MSEKSPPPTNYSPVLAVIDEKTMDEVRKLAARYGVDPDEVLAELIRLDMTVRPAGVTLH